MLIGHYAPALALSRARPAIPLWVLFLATQAVDVLWGGFILKGVEHARIVPGFTESNALDLYDMPYSHSLVATLVWSAIFALAWRFYRAQSLRGAAAGEAWVIFVAVASHFVGDLVVHVHDLPLLGTHGTKWGFGLWRHRELALLVEGSSFVLAAAFWWQPRSNRRPRAAAVLGAMTLFLVASFYIPAPPTAQLMALAGLTTYAVCAFGIGWATHEPRPGMSG